MQFVVGKSSGLSVLYACVRPKMRHLTPDLLTQVFLFPPQISLPHSPCPTLPAPRALSFSPYQVPSSVLHFQASICFTRQLPN